MFANGAVVLIETSVPRRGARVLVPTRLVADTTRPVSTRRDPGVGGNAEVCRCELYVVGTQLDAARRRIFRAGGRAPQLTTPRMSCARAPPADGGTPLRV